MQQLKALAPFALVPMLLLGALAGARMQASQDLPFSNADGGVEAAPTVTVTATVTASPDVPQATLETPGGQPGAEPGDDASAEALPPASPGPVPDGWITYYAQTVTVGYKGVDFGRKPPEPVSNGNEFRVEGTDNGDPYLVAYTDNLVKLKAGDQIDANSCRERAASISSQGTFVEIEKGDRFCMYLETNSNGNLAIHLVTEEVTNNGLEGSSAEFQATAWVQTSG